MALEGKDLEIHIAALFEAMTRASAKTNYTVDLNRSDCYVSLVFTTYNDGGVINRKSVNQYNEDGIMNHLLYNEVFTVRNGYRKEYRKLDRLDQHVSLNAVEMLRELSANFKNYGVDFMNIYNEELDKAIHEGMKANAE